VRFRMNASKYSLKKKETPSVCFVQSISGNCEPSGSVSIVSGYGLDYRAIEVRSPAEGK
jgi:hypothetical protein